VKAPPPARQLKAFLDRYTPEVARVARAALARMRRLVPGAVELVYDNYNALVIGFGPTERTSEVLLSIAVYPRWVNLFFLHGARLSDPERLLKGGGKRVRHIVLEDASVLDRPGVRKLITQALGTAVSPIDRGGHRRMIIRSISPKQRARRPPAGASARAKENQP